MRQPWDSDPIVQERPAAPPPAASVVTVVPPNPQPSPQTDAQRRAQEAAAARGEQQLPQTDTGGVNFTDENTLRQRFRAEPPVRAYEDVLPAYASAMYGARDTRAGDLNLVYAFGKLMDPGSVVREGEMVMVRDTGSLGERVQGYLNQISGEGALTPRIRAELRAELRSRGQGIAQEYNRLRRDYGALSERYGFDRNAVIGTHPATSFRPRGEPVNPLAAPPGTHVQFADERGPELAWSDDQISQLQSFVQQAQTPEQLDAFARRLSGGRNGLSNAREILEEYRRSGRVPEMQARIAPPDISEMRGGGGTGEAIDATARGVADVATLGFSDEISAGLETMLGDDSYDENLRRQRAIDTFDEENHTIARTVGQLAGGVIIPTRVVGASRVAAQEALRAGLSRAEAVTVAKQAAARQMAAESGAAGAAYGVGSGEGDTFQERALDSLSGAVVDGLLSVTAGFAAGRAGLGAGRVPEERPPLVDQATGRLNQPLESVAPAERMAAAAEHGVDLPAGAAGGRSAAIVEKGLDIVPGSAGVMDQARRRTEGQVERAVDRVAGRYGPGTTLYAAGSALQRGARNWISRFDELSSKAYEAIPIRPGVEAVLTNTRATLDQLTSTFQSNPEMASVLRNTRLLAYRDALASGSLSWQDLKAFRSRIGAEIGDARFSDSPTRDEMRSLYAALSEDMRATAQAQGPGALRAFERANTLYRQGQERIDNALVRILGDDSRTNPESAARAVQTIANSGRGSSNLDQLAQIRASLAKGGEWGEVASTLIRLMGQPLNREGRQFSPQTFVDNYAGMSEPARNLLFGDRGRRELRGALDGFVAVNQRLAGTNALRNTSNTVPGITGAGAVGAATAGVLNPLLGAKVVAAAGGAYGMARLWTTPGFVRWATGYTRMLNGASRAGARPTAKNLQRQRNYLVRIARRQPSLAAEIGGLEAELFPQGDESPNQE